MRKIAILFLSIFLALSPVLRADEGMWIPILIEQFNIKIMQEKGFKLTAEDIYSVNKACMKDAVLIFGGGCTGELISGEGLLITNHHCGYGQIQSHSSLEHDYLTNGFWAMSRQEELANPGLSVTFLKWMEDVTARVLDGVDNQMSEVDRQNKVNANISAIVREATSGNEYSAFVRPFYMGNQYFLFVNETFRDVRLVGAPPSAIGKFGGETDNWMWPRHTGDFSLFRIYANRENKPAEYSEDNVPYKPGYFFPISLKGVREGDFTMVFGYPGGTSQYVPSYYIEMLTETIYPDMIRLRDKKLEIIIADMEADPGVRIQYSSKKSGIANSWKRWIGESIGLEKLDAVEKKREFEGRFNMWANSTPERKARYGSVIPDYEKYYGEYKNYRFVSGFTNEILGRSGIEAVSLASGLISAVERMEAGETAEGVSRSLSMASRRAPGFFKDYNQPTDKKLFVALMELYGNVLDEKWQAEEYRSLLESCNGDFASVADRIYAESFFTDEGRYMQMIDNFSESMAEKVKNDPIFKLARSAASLSETKIAPRYSELGYEISMLDRVYMEGQLLFVKDKVLWPDANSTLRVAYGNVSGYEPRDGVYHVHYSTLKGIIEKDNPEIYDYDVPDRLKELYSLRDYGRYAQDGEIPVCFIANNHTTGGNSGSPVINADGHLIGINFDRAWEGVMSDMMYNPARSRNISLDIRYALFIIDKFAGAGYLLNEMKLVE